MIEEKEKKYPKGEEFGPRFDGLLNLGLGQKNYNLWASRFDENRPNGSEKLDWEMRLENEAQRLGVVSPAI